MAAGFVMTLAASSDSAALVPPIDTCGAPNPIMRMPFVAHAGEATAIPIAAASQLAFLMTPSPLTDGVCNRPGGLRSPCQPKEGVMPRGSRAERRRDETVKDGLAQDDESFEGPRGSNTAGDPYLMNDAWLLLALVAVWLLLQYVLLPRLGVPT
jgi:hypothetical protein